jgi:membrane-associated phospholipid phosphatase
MSLAGPLAGAPDAAPWPRRFAANFGHGMATVVRAHRVKAGRIERAYLQLLTAALPALLVIGWALAFVDGPVAEAVKHAPGWVIVVFDVLTDFGRSGWFLWPLGGVLLVLAVLASTALAPVQRLIIAAVAVRAGFLFAAIAAPSLFVTVIKRVIGRARPFVGEHADPFHYVLFSWRADYASMPSGHATTAFAAAVAVGVLWPRLRAPMLVYALVIAVSRVVLDAHYVSDVIAGAIAGVIGAFLVRDWFAARRLGFAVGPQGGVRALPGPSWARIKRVARRLPAP